jgi:DnaJ-class molecular chaperone
MSNPYDVLGVAKTATSKEIKSAFRKLAKKYHPDSNPDDPKAKERFNAANQAYEIIGDEKRRAAYDRGEIDGEGKPRFQGFENAGGGGDPFAAFRNRQQGPGGAHFEFRDSGFQGNPEDIFSHIFGDAFAGRTGQHGAGPFASAGRRAPKGADVAATLEISIEEAATAAKVTAIFPGGRKLAVKLPESLEDGQTIRLKGQGEPGLGGAGDALVTLRFKPHPRFRIEGRDLHVDVPVQLEEAVLGGKVAVETPTGRVALSLPAWSSSDKVLRLKGRGLPSKGGGHGNLYAHIRIMLPADGNPELEALMRRSHAS